MTEIICTIITAAATIIVALLGIHIKRANDRIERREDRRERETLLNLQLTLASVDLGTVCANAVMDYKNNGNVEEAYKNAREAKEEYEKFIQEVYTQEVNAC